MKILLFLLTISSFAIAEDQCTMGREAVESVLDGKSSAVKKFTPGKVSGNAKEGWNLLESALLKEGLVVGYKVGGCDHYGYEFNFDKIGEQKVGTKEEVLNLADKLIGKAPVKNKDHVNQLKEAIKDARKSEAKLENGILLLPCGEAECAVNVQEKGKVSLSYSFAI